MSELATFCFPTTIIFGPGAVKSLREELRARGIRRPLVVTDGGLARLPLFEEIRAEMDGGFPVFDGVDPNPTERNVLDGVARYCAEGCDALLGVGGGSALDAAKAIRLKVTHPLPLAEYDDLKDGSRRISANLPAFLAVPTTAGTGSDVSRSTVVTMAGRKTVIFSPHLIPSLSLSDPALTLGMPPKITAGTGMDAFTHNFEAYLALGYHPICDAIALEGVRLVWRNLPRVMDRAGDLEARSNMMMAAIMGAVAFQKGLGAVHSLAHPLSTIGGMHHGTSNAVMLPWVIEFNAAHVPQRLKELGSVIGRPNVADAVRELNRLIGIPERLRDYGITEGMLAPMAALAMKDGCRLLNPRPCSEQDMLALYRQAW